MPIRDEKWVETEYVRPMNMRVSVRKFLWSGYGVSAKTGEDVPLSYYQQAVIPDDQNTPDNREFRESRAKETLTEMVSQARAGRGYIVAYSRLGLIERNIADVFDEDFAPGQHTADEIRESVLDAIRRGDAEYEQHRAAAIRLGAAVDDFHRWGWEIPLVNGDGVPA